MGLLSGNTPLFVITALACRANPLVFVPLSPTLPDAVIRERLRQADVDLLIAEEEQQERVQRLQADASTITASRDGQEWTLGRSISRGRRADPDLVAILFSSGTTGTPRAWRYTEQAVNAHAQAATKRLGMDSDSVLLGVLALQHAGGFMLLDRSIRLDATLVLEERFDAQHALNLIKEHGVTHTSLVPIMLARLLELDNSPPPSLTCVLLGGDAVPRDLRERACGKNWPIHTTYGLTETCSQAATATPAIACAKPGTAGPALEGVRIEIQRDDGTACASHEEGRIVISGATLAIPYPRQARPSRLLTDDYGYLDEDAHLFVTGRSIHRIITAGHTVDALKVEAALEQHPGVAAACVVGIPHPERGQTIAAAVESTRVTLDAQEVVRFMRERLPRHAVAHRIRIVDELPRTSLGKKDRATIQNAMAAADDERLVV